MGVKRKTLQYGEGNVITTEDMQDFVVMDLTYSGNPQFYNSLPADKFYTKWHKGRLMIVRLTHELAPEKVIEYNGRLDVLTCSVYKDDKIKLIISLDKITNQVKYVNGVWGTDTTLIKDQNKNGFINKRSKQEKDVGNYE